MLRLLATAALLVGCGPSVPARTTVTSSAADVSAVEALAPVTRPPEELEQDPLEGVVSVEQAPDRRGGRLIVRSPPDNPTPNVPSSFRRDVEGGFGADDERVWVGAELPDYIELVDEALELTLVDAVNTGFVATYRAPYGSKSCPSETSGICASSVVHYAPTGKVLWRYQLESLLPRKDKLEVRDIRYKSPILYFNHACPSGAKPDEVCDVVVAMDTQTSKIVWRSKAHASTSRLLVFDDYIVAAARSQLGKSGIVLIRRSDGEVLDRSATAFLATHLEAESAGVVMARDVVGASVRLQVVEGARLAPVPSAAVR